MARLQRLEMSGELLTCVETSPGGHCLRYIQTCDGEDCITESPQHPVVPGRKAKKKKKKKPAAKTLKTKAQKTVTASRQGKKEPWKMSKVEWNKAVDATHPGTPFTSKPTKGSGAEMDRKLTEHLRLNYDAGILDLATNRVITDHKLVIAKAYNEGRKIPKGVLEEYPDMEKFVKSPEYQESRKTLTESIEQDTESRRKVAAEKKLLKIDTVYDADLEKSVMRVQQQIMDNPKQTGVNYYLRTKSAKRTYVDSMTPFKGQSYVQVDPGGVVRRFGTDGKLIPHDVLKQVDMIYPSNVEDSIKQIQDLPSDRRRGQKYYITEMPGDRSYVASKTPGQGQAYARVDYRGVQWFDATGEPVKAGSTSVMQKFDVPMLGPENAQKWELENPPVLLDPAKGLKKLKGEFSYLISNTSARGRSEKGTDYQMVYGKPLSYPDLDDLDLFVHKYLTKGGGFGWAVSEVSTGLQVMRADTRKEAIERLEHVVKNKKQHPKKYQEMIAKPRRIREYPHLQVAFDRVQTMHPTPGSQIRPVSGLSLAGDLLTCSKWQLIGQEPNQYIRCAELKQTCKPGDADCAEPGKVVEPDDRTTGVKEGLEIKTHQNVEFTVPGGAKKTGTISSIQDGIVYVIPDGGTNSVPAVTIEKVIPTKYVGKRPELVSGPYGAFWFNVVKGGTNVNEIPKEVVGPDFEDYLNPDTGRSYLVFAYGKTAARKTLTDNLERIRAFRKEYGQGFISDQPTKQTIKRPGAQTLTYHVQPVENYEAYLKFLEGQNVKDLVDSRLVLERSSYHGKTPKPEQIWMKEKPFTKDDTHDYNRYTYYPIKDLNDEFENSVKPKLDEVSRLMKEYDVTEIPAEVQTALMWYRRRTYEYLKRKIYSRNNAPGTHIVGASNYNQSKHNKVIAADKKFWENLETSGRKLETAIKKTITRGRGGKPAVSVKEREKWQAVAVKTKRTAFGKLVLENQIAYNKANPEKAPKSIDLSDPKSTFRATVRAQGRNIHARLILDAHQRELEIDPEVLAQYPALTPNLSGIGAMLQAANALYSLAKVAL